MKVFSKNITEQIWRSHLKNYSCTLFGWDSELRNLLQEKYYEIPFHNIYLCPLCLKNMFALTKNGVEGNSQFSLDHLPPDSVGGRFKILTCKKCNNNSGTFEAELTKLMNFAEDENDSSASVLKNIKIKDATNGNYLLANLRNKNNQTNILFNESAKKFNPKYLKFLEQLHSGKLKKIELEVPLYDSKKIEKALLKSAYLLCFIWWGYEFVFSENGFRIRQVLNDELEYPIKVPLSWSKLEEAPKGISLLSFANERKAFVCGIELKGRVNETIANILIPSPSVNGWDQINEIKSMLKENSLTSFNLMTVPRIPHHMAYTISWNIVPPQNSDE